MEILGSIHSVQNLFTEINLSEINSVVAPSQSRSLGFGGAFFSYMIAAPLIPYIGKLAGVLYIVLWIFIYFKVFGICFSPNPMSS